MEKLEAQSRVSAIQIPDTITSVRQDISVCMLSGEQTF